jgi:asparagine synthase (glutamine-hydrolysing)
MCGINGIIDTDGDNHLVEKIHQMNNCIIHRGPDDDGVYMHNNQIALGMRRLSIIDLAHGKQPIYNHDRSIVITFNGEIYNYKDIKKELIAKGNSFNTESDTEVVLKLYELYGEKSLDYLNGMFAFAIHDVKKGIIFIARDRFGEKPLYYTQIGNTFIWASELKSIVNIKPQAKQISIEALNIFFSLSYIPAPLSIYKDVYKLKAGHYTIINTSDLTYSIKKYWDVNQTIPSAEIPYGEAKAKIRELVFESVEKRMIADVPLGVFLSGGVDSSIVAAVMSKISGQKIKTFSVGYHEKKYDESERASLVANHIQSDHHEFILNFDELLPEIDKVILNYDEPFADSSALPTYYISKKTKSEVVVALTGDGGDEVFAGYNKYLLNSYGAKYRKYVPGFIHNTIIKPFVFSRLFKTNNTKSLKHKIKKLFAAFDDDILSSHLNIISLGFNKVELKRLMEPDYFTEIKPILSNYIELKPQTITDVIKEVRYIDKQTSLEGDMLVKVDRASMLCSLECRSPFLDHRIFEYTYSLPDSYLLKGSTKKRILKDSFEDLLPDNFFNYPKAGFEIPISYWFRNELKNDLIDTLSEENINKHGYLNHSVITELIQKHLNGHNYSYQLWVLFCFQKWYNKHF